MMKKNLILVSSGQLRRPDWPSGLMSTFLHSALTNQRHILLQYCEKKNNEQTKISHITGKGIIKGSRGRTRTRCSPRIPTQSRSHRAGNPLRCAPLTSSERRWNCDSPPTPNPPTRSAAGAPPSLRGCADVTRSASPHTSARPDRSAGGDLE